MDWTLDTPRFSPTEVKECTERWFTEANSEARSANLRCKLFGLNLFLKQGRSTPYLVKRPCYFTRCEKYVPQ